MKRLFIILSMTIVALAVSAKTPQINVVQLFDGRFNNETTVTTSIVKENGKYCRMLNVENNPTIVKKIAETLAKDTEKASKYFEQTGTGGKSTIIKMTLNGETIDIGFQQGPDGKSASLFIIGSEKAFK